MVRFYWRRYWMQLFIEIKLSISDAQCRRHCLDNENVAVQHQFVYDIVLTRLFTSDNLQVAVLTRLHNRQTHPQKLQHSLRPMKRI